MLLEIDSQTLLKIDPQVLLEINPQTLLKISFTSGTKLKNLLAGTARLKLLTKQNKTMLRKWW